VFFRCRDMYSHDHVWFKVVLVGLRRPAISYAFFYTTHICAHTHAYTHNFLFRAKTRTACVHSPSARPSSGRVPGPVPFYLYGRRINSRPDRWVRFILYLTARYDRPRADRLRVVYPPTTYPFMRCFYVSLSLLFSYQWRSGEHSGTRVRPFYGFYPFYFLNDNRSWSRVSQPFRIVGRISRRSYSTHPIVFARCRARHGFPTCNAK